MATLPKLGLAPNFTGIVSWLNTPDDKPLSLTQLRGKVVLVDFWTYSCINCQRSLPHVEGWYNDYKKDGLVVVGVSTPEFAFEHVVSNVRSAAGHLGVDYPIAIDNNDDTWDAYGNEYWPAEYLIDPTGDVRAYDFGEGGYGAMESDIRELLTANGVTALPPRTDVADKTPVNQTTPESYVGYEEAQSDAAGTALVHDKPLVYKAPDPVPINTFALERDMDGSRAGSDCGFRCADLSSLRGQRRVPRHGRNRHRRCLLQRTTSLHTRSERGPAPLHPVLRKSLANGPIGPSASVPACRRTTSPSAETVLSGASPPMIIYALP